MSTEEIERQAIERKKQEREFYFSANPPLKDDPEFNEAMKKCKSIEDTLELNRQKMVKMERDIVASFIDIEFFEDLGAYELRKIVNFLREMVVKKEDEEEEEEEREYNE